MLARSGAASVSAAVASVSSDCEARRCALRPSGLGGRPHGDLCPQAAGQGSVHGGPHGCPALRDHRERFFGPRLASVARTESGSARELLFLEPLLGPHGLVKLCCGCHGSPELFLGLWVQGSPCALLAGVQNHLPTSCVLQKLIHHREYLSS